MTPASSSGAASSSSSCAAYQQPDSHSSSLHTLIPSFPIAASSSSESKLSERVTTRACSSSELTIKDVRNYLRTIQTESEINQGIVEVPPIIFECKYSTNTDISISVNGRNYVLSGRWKQYADAQWIPPQQFIIDILQPDKQIEVSISHSGHYRGHNTAIVCDELIQLYTANEGRDITDKTTGYQYIGYLHGVKTQKGRHYIIDQHCSSEEMDPELATIAKFGQINFHGRDVSKILWERVALLEKKAKSAHNKVQVDLEPVEGLPAVEVTTKGEAHRVTNPRHQKEVIQRLAIILEAERLYEQPAFSEKSGSYFLCDSVEKGRKMVPLAEITQHYTPSAQLRSIKGHLCVEPYNSVRSGSPKLIEIDTKSKRKIEDYVALDTITLKQGFRHCRFRFDFNTAKALQKAITRLIDLKIVNPHQLFIDNCSLYLYGSIELSKAVKIIAPTDAFAKKKEILTLIGDLDVNPAECQQIIDNLQSISDVDFPMPMTPSSPFIILLNKLLNDYKQFFYWKGVDLNISYMCKPDKSLSGLKVTINNKEALELWRKKGIPSQYIFRAHKRLRIILELIKKSNSTEALHQAEHEFRQMVWKDEPDTELDFKSIMQQALNQFIHRDEPVTSDLSSFIRCGYDPLDCIHWFLDVNRDQKGEKLSAIISLLEVTPHDYLPPYQDITIRIIRYFPDQKELIPLYDWVIKRAINSKREDWIGQMLTKMIDFISYGEKPAESPLFQYAIQSNRRRYLFQPVNLPNYNFNIDLIHDAVRPIDFLLIPISCSCSEHDDLYLSELLKLDANPWAILKLINKYPFIKMRATVSLLNSMIEKFQSSREITDWCKKDPHEIPVQFYEELFYCIPNFDTKLATFPFKHLLDMGIDPRFKLKNKSALQQAFYHSKTNVIDLLMEHLKEKGEPITNDELSRLLFDFASSESRFKKESFEALFGAGASAVATYYDEEIGELINSFERAIINGNQEEASAIYEGKKDDFLKQDEYGYRLIDRALCASVRFIKYPGSQHIACIRFLMEKGADPMKEGSTGETALEIAENVLKGAIHLEMVKQGHPFEHSELIELFNFSARAGDVKALSYLYDRAPLCLNLVNEEAGSRPLDDALSLVLKQYPLVPGGCCHLSTTEGYNECIKFLLDQGANIFLSADGETQLSKLPYYKYPQILTSYPKFYSMLFDQAIKTNGENQKVYVDLVMIAAKNCNVPDLLKLLSLESKDSLSSRGPDQGKIDLILYEFCKKWMYHSRFNAKNEELKQVIQLLLEGGANPTSHGSFTDTSVIDLLDDHETCQYRQDHSEEIRKMIFALHPPK